MLEFTKQSAVQMLGGLKSWLRKAEEQLPEDKTATLLSERLAPDMFPLTTQIRFACVQALEAIYRLQGRDFPPLVEAILNEGRQGGEKAGTIADAIARIDETIAHIEVATNEAPCLDGDAPVAIILPMGMTFDVKAEQSLRDWALPQFYFHLSIAYAILRAQGVMIGKADYIGHMLSFLRQPAAAEG